MGACEFDVVAVGKDASEAYAKAVEDALYWSGHGGYTGTIAEKDGFKSFGIVRGMTPDQFLDHYRNVVHGALTPAQYEEVAEVRREQGWDAAIALSERYHTATRTKARNELPAPIKAVLSDRLIAVADGDKWGPAACVEFAGDVADDIKASRGRQGTNDRVFLFFGWAST